MAKKRTGKSKISPQLVEKLEDLLKKFEKSSRFEFFAQLPVGNFAPDLGSNFPALNELPLAELVRLGAGKVAFAKNCSNLILERLIEVVEKLCIDSTSIAQGDGDPGGPGAGDLPDPVVSQVLGAASRRNLRMAGNAQAEQRLTNAINTLRASSDYPQIAGRTLGEFWEEGWPRAPFEECLTFKQLQEIDVQALLKKRSLNPQKVDAIIQAVEKGVAGRQSGMPPPATSQDARPILWRQSPPELPLFAVAILRDFERQSSELRTGHVARMARIIHEHLSPFEFLCMLISIERDELSSAAILNCEVAALGSSLQAGAAKLDAQLKQELPEIHTHWATALAGSGLALSLLTDPYLNRQQDTAFQDMVCAVFLRALGGGKLTVLGVDFRGCVARSSQTLEMMIRAILNSLPKSDSELQAELRALFPLLPIETLIQVVEKLADLRHPDRIWLAKVK